MQDAGQLEISLLVPVTKKVAGYVWHATQMVSLIRVLPRLPADEYTGERCDLVFVGKGPKGGTERNVSDNTMA
jgi:hypothetical protein